MTVKTIPLKKILICDRCKKEDERGSGAFQYGGLHMAGESWGVCFGGDVGVYQVAYDFCNDCRMDFEKWVNSNDSNQAG